MVTLDFFKTIEEFRTYVRGISAGTKLEEVFPSFNASANKVIDIIGLDIWNDQKEYYKNGNGLSTDKNQLNVYLQGALANLTMFEHFAFIAADKNGTDNKLYKYQEQKIEEKYISNAWGYLNSMLSYLDSKKDVFVKWIETDTYKSRLELILKSHEEFNALYSIDNSPYFFTKTVFLQKEIIDDEILPRIGKLAQLNDQVELTKKVKRAIVYKVMAMACVRFDISELPKSIRNDVSNEHNRGNSKQESYVKEVLADRLERKADLYLESIDFLMQQLINEDNIVPAPVDINSEDNSHYLMP